MRCERMANVYSLNTKYFGFFILSVSSVYDQRFGFFNPDFLKRRLSFEPKKKLQNFVDFCSAAEFFKRGPRRTTGRCQPEADFERKEK